MQMCHVTLGKGHDPDAGEGHTFEEPGNILLVTAETIHRFGEHDREPSTHRILD